MLSNQPDNTLLMTPGMDTAAVWALMASYLGLCDNFLPANIMEFAS